MWTVVCAYCVEYRLYYRHQTSNNTAKKRDSKLPYHKMFGNPLGGFTLDEHTMFSHNEQEKLAAILSREPRNFVCNR